MTITVRDLIAELEEHPQDALLYFEDGTINSIEPGGDAYRVADIPGPTEVVED